MASRKTAAENLKKRRKSHLLDAAEILLAAAVLVFAAFLFLYWRTKPFLFCLEFGCATALFAVLTVDTARNRQNGRTARLISNMICTALMIAFLTVSLLVVVRG